MKRTIPAVALLLAAVVAAIGLYTCGDDRPPPVTEVKPQGGLAFAFVDVAESTDFLLRNRTGTDTEKNFILEAMPPASPWPTTTATAGWTCTSPTGT